MQTLQIGDTDKSEGSQALEDSHCPERPAEDHLPQVGFFDRQGDAVQVFFWSAFCCCQKKKSPNPGNVQRLKVCFCLVLQAKKSWSMQLVSTGPWLLLGRDMAEGVN